MGGFLTTKADDLGRLGTATGATATRQAAVRAHRLSVVAKSKDVRLAKEKAAWEKRRKKEKHHNHHHNQQQQQQQQPEFMATTSAERRRRASVAQSKAARALASSERYAEAEAWAVRQRASHGTGATEAEDVGALASPTAASAARKAATLAFRRRRASAAAKGAAAQAAYADRMEAATAGEGGQEGRRATVAEELGHFSVETEAGRQRRWAREAAAAVAEAAAAAEEAEAGHHARLWMARQEKKAKAAQRAAAPDSPNPGAEAGDARLPRPAQRSSKGKSMDGAAMAKLVYMYSTDSTYRAQQEAALGAGGSTGRSSTSSGRHGDSQGSGILQEALNSPLAAAAEMI